jgi:hypothetical protein
MSSVRGLVLAGMVGLLWAVPAAGQDAAEGHLDRGVALRRDGQDEAALREFRAAWEVSHSPRALAQIALAEQALGHWVDAESSLVSALEDSEDRWIRHHLAALQASLSEIRQRIGRLDVRGNVPGSEVVVGGREVGTLPLGSMLHIETGTVTFTVRHEGYVPVTRTVVIRGGFPLRENVVLEPVPDAEAVPPAGLAAGRQPAEGGPLNRRLPVADASPVAPTPARPTMQYVSYGLIGGGALGLVLSAVFLGVNASTEGSATSATATSPDPYGAWARFYGLENPTGTSSAGEMCDRAEQRSTADAQAVRDLCARVSSSASASLAMAIVGSALAGGGVALMFVTRPSRTSARAPNWSVTPWVAQRTGGVVVGGTW